MISKLDIKNVGYYDSDGICFEPTKINFIYGANGSGKTSISRIIADKSRFQNCQLDWVGNNDLKTLVYNRDFIEQNFSSSKEIRGIFTLGEDLEATQREIEKKKKEFDLAESILKQNTISLELKYKDLANLERHFADRCWEYKTEYDEYFKDAFTGLRADKNKFKERFLNETSNASELKVKDYLLEKASVIFDKSSTALPVFQNIEFQEFLNIETDEIQKTKIIGKEDINISLMIKKLNNSDWVRKGREYLQLNDDLCPFCQQDTTEEFRQELENYFDEVYTEQITKLYDFKANYTQELSSIITKISYLIEENHKYIDNENLESALEVLKALQANHNAAIDRKIAEPSTVLEIHSLKTNLENIFEILNVSIEKTIEHNNSIRNIDQEKRVLTSQIWKYIVTEKAVECEQYTKVKSNLGKAVQGINRKVSDNREILKNLKNAITELESRITSVLPTITKINSILNSFGFTNFRLAEAPQAGFYKVIRDNGDDASSTLSEGEKTFLTFLYFYNLLKGSTDETPISSNKIVVFDDPISSLDSTVLFIVSSLIRSIIKEVKEDKSNIKQVFVLTHNIYFHKEITFRKDKNNVTDESFWIIRKLDKRSLIYHYPENPIKTSYELLWHELRDKPNIRVITIPNTLRRILENYFKVLGGYKDDKILESFEGEELSLCNSLMSWINDGSHSINDDLYIDIEHDAVDKYLTVFKKIFNELGHDAHYRMMMKEEELVPQL